MAGTAPVSDLLANHKPKEQMSIIKLIDIKWDSDRADLPTELDVQIDMEHVEEMTEQGFDPEEIIDQMLYDDLSEEYGADLTEFTIVDQA